MLRDLSKYIGCTVELIYMDRRGRITQRTVRIRSAENGWITAFCLSRSAPRLFKAEHILAVQRMRAQ